MSEWIIHAVATESHDTEWGYIQQGADLSVTCRTEAVAKALAVVCLSDTRLKDVTLTEKTTTVTTKAIPI